MTTGDPMLPRRETSTAVQPHIQPTGGNHAHEVVEQAIQESQPLPEWRDAMQEPERVSLGCKPQEFELPVGPDAQIAVGIHKAGVIYTVFRWDGSWPTDVPNVEALKAQAPALWLPVLDAACRVLRRMVENKPD